MLITQSVITQVSCVRICGCMSIWVEPNKNVVAIQSHTFPMLDIVFLHLMSGSWCTVLIIACMYNVHTCRYVASWLFLLSATTKAC